MADDNDAVVATASTIIVAAAIVMIYYAMGQHINTIIHLLLINKHRYKIYGRQTIQT